MSDNDFDQKLEEIERGYASHREGAEAYRDQEISRLFVECGWTQDRIAERMGRSQGWVQKRLMFGAFLRFNPDRINSSLTTQTLTEWRFRETWRASGKGHAKETEEERFERVLKLLEQSTSDVPRGYGNIVKKPGIQKAVVEALTESKRLNVGEIVELVGETIPGVDRFQVGLALKRIQHRPPQGMAFEARHNGSYHKYRLVPSKRRNGPIPVVDAMQAGAMAVDALPLIDECINILKHPIVGRQTTLALEHLWRVRQMVNHLLVPEEVV